MTLEVIATGPAATIQDLGRPGLAELGVGASGAADPPSLRLANRLVGSPEGHAGIEVTFGGLVARFGHIGLIAVTGAPCPITVTSPDRRARSHGMYCPITAYAGDELRLGPPSRGLRNYLAVRGGIQVAPVLGSRATDTLADLGPAPLQPGSRLVIGERAWTTPTSTSLPSRPTPISRCCGSPPDHATTGSSPTRSPRCAIGPATR